MSIPYAIYRNNLTEDVHDFMARFKPRGTINQEALMDRMATMGSTVGRADMLAVLETYRAAVQAYVLEGYNVNTPLCNFSASIRGHFSGSDDRFDASRHHLGAVARPGRAWKPCLKSARMEKVGVRIPSPVLMQYLDVNSGARNTVLTPGGIGELRGRRLKCHREDPAEGVFFIDTGRSETRVTTLATNHPGLLIFQVPALASGTYRLAVRSCFGAGSIREGALSQSLTVHE